MVGFGLEAETTPYLCECVYMRECLSLCVFSQQQGSAVNITQCWYANTTAVSCP